MHFLTVSALADLPTLTRAYLLELLTFCVVVAITVLIEIATCYCVERLPVRGRRNVIRLLDISPANR
jgi:ABC-type sulfate transport system permease subunit